VKTPTCCALIVEDYRAERLLLKHQLHRLSFLVVEAADGASALARLLERRFDLVCLDLMLPDLTGLQICEFIRASRLQREVPILVLSARALPEDRAAAEEAGASGYLVKPFDWDDFNAEVRRLVPGYRTDALVL
jgi:two-component system chemotaxis response regulator CheY